MPSSGQLVDCGDKKNQRGRLKVFVSPMTWLLSGGLGIQIQKDLRGSSDKRYFYRESLIFGLIDNVLQEDIDQVDIIPSIKSDHSAILLVIGSVDNQTVDPPFGNLMRAYRMTKNMLTCIELN